MVHSGSVSLRSWRCEVKILLTEAQMFTSDPHNTLTSCSLQIEFSITKTMGSGGSTDNSGSGNTNCGNTNTGNIGGSNIEINFNKANRSFRSLPAQNIPWREVDWSDSALAELVTRVKTFKPKGASQLRVLLYGPAGSGKSAFVDSVAGAVDGQSVTLTEAGGTAFTSHTLKLKGDKDTRSQLCSTT
ncbi:hypothetical protein WMY93_028139 [Mugilogobius chulae]|uniref:Uncharacterized protein n=1 Tax=Mugilogobius chulae TaxID=88201 RepID=A0AAW0MR39_9GOBI